MERLHLSEMEQHFTEIMHRTPPQRAVAIHNCTLCSQLFMEQYFTTRKLGGPSRAQLPAFGPLDFVFCAHVHRNHHDGFQSNG